MLSAEQNRLIEKVARDDGFDHFSVFVEDGSKKGDNYLGNIFLITIKEGDGAKEKSLILKCALKNELVRAQMPINECYKREVFLYDTVLSAFKKLQEEHPLPHPFEAYAKMYGFSLKEGDEWLLLENIRTRGFAMLDRKVAMEAAHVSAVMEELGKLHSLSFVMKQLEPDQYRKLEANLNDYFKDCPHIAERFTEGVENNFQRAYRTVEGDEEATEGLKKCERLIHNALKEIQEERDNFVIVHADTWCNNMMFKYEDTNYSSKPTQVCFLDWQISKVAVPVTDVFYFMFLSGSKEVLDNHKTHLRQYYRVVEDNLGAVGLEAKSVYPYGVLEHHWKKYCKIGLYIALAQLDTLLKDQKDAQSFTDMAEEDGDIFKALRGHGGSQNEQTSNRIKDIILMMAENKYL